MNTLSNWLDRYSLYLALLAAWIATSGSLYFSEVMGFVPCRLCWFQRILMYPLTLVLAIGLVRRDRHLPVLVLPFSVLGLLIATYHYLLEKTDLFVEGEVCSGGVSCTVVWINWFGFVTIPFLSLTGFLIITIMTVIALQAQEPNDEEAGRAPWAPVAVIIVGVLLAFGLLAWFNTSSQAAAFSFPVLVADAATQQSRVNTDVASWELVAQGERLYRTACASCHGNQGEGAPNIGGALAGSTFLTAQTDAAVMAFLRTGRAADSPATHTGVAMPPSGGRPDLTDQELQAIIAYLRQSPQE